MSSFSPWGNAPKPNSPSFSSIVATQSSETANQNRPISSDIAVPSSVEDEEEQLRIALAISASLAPTTSSSEPSKTPSEDESLALVRALSGQAGPSEDDESLALAHKLAEEDRLEYEEFQRRNVRNLDKNNKVQVEYFRGSAVSSGSGEETPERFGADDVERYNILYGEDGRERDEEEEEAYKMNDNRSSATNFFRVGDTVVSKSGEVFTKHDPKLKFGSNAKKLQLGNDGKIGNSAYNQLKRDMKSKKKGVQAHGHGRAEEIGGGKTHSGALDSSTLQVIRKAIDKGYIDACHGIVREGKEGVILFAEGGKDVRKRGEDEDADIFLPRYAPATTCVKCYKRIVAFKNRGDYVDGDVRYYKKRFSDVDKRDQLTLWAEKEFRNMTRAFVGGVSCPRPVMTKENVCMMTFFGRDGFPALTLKEVADLGFVGVNEKKLKKLFAETIVGIRRLWWCAQLVHGDLSEYNLLLCDSKQVRDQISSEVDEDIEGSTSMEIGKRRIVFIDFAQSVQREHPSGRDLLLRDVARVVDFWGRFIEVPSQSTLIEL
eukprot:CAMPEP_0118652244 /NCGR_PEP_ID=MMETSP0785-20121206/11214_1 /TAXON_ID=91992 /ORGANISM="Bolidomonas pacifica, Strain CCMP 1866" /LENGTH=544 /DNA_ID=CAMNT_0006544747 /DNA_START=65 /DNA_END=1695 /DNA_ORIENTATION=+